MIRHYENLGLIPAPDRRPSGYRVYGEEDVRRLGLIAAARHLGFSMADITALMKDWDDGTMENVAARWRSKIASRAKALAVLQSIVETEAAVADRR